MTYLRFLVRLVPDAHPKHDLHRLEGEANAQLWCDVLHTVIQRAGETVRTSSAKAAVRGAVEWKLELLCVLLDQGLVPTATLSACHQQLLELVSTATSVPTPAGVRLLRLILERCVWAPVCYLGLFPCHPRSLCVSFVGLVFAWLRARVTQRPYAFAFEVRTRFLVASTPAMHVLLPTQGGAPRAQPVAHSSSDVAARWGHRL